MATRATITEKTTKKLNFQLLSAGSPANITGATLALLLTDRLGTVIANPTVTIETANTGKVSFSPTGTDLVAANSPYYAKWKVTDGSGKITYFPNGLRDVWEVAQE